MNRIEATQYIKATLTAFGPDEAISMTKETWAKLHEAMKELAEQPAQQQEPWGWAIMHSDGTEACVRARVSNFFGVIQEREPFTAEDLRQADSEGEGLAPHRIVTLYTSPPARKPWLAQTVIDAARAAMDESFEAGNEQMDISIPAHLAAALSLCLDEYDREALAEQPAQRKPLTDEEIIRIEETIPTDANGVHPPIDIARAIEAAHGIKENT